MEEKKEKFEDKIQSIEAIIQALSQEHISLEESLKLYKEGAEKIKEATSMLEKAEILFQEIKKENLETSDE